MPKASLPMYDIAELREVTDAWWKGLVRHFKAVGIRNLPERLERPREVYAHWLDPTLIFSQTCGYPLMHELSGRVHVVATPCYCAPGCSGPRYTSYVVIAEKYPTDIALAALRGVRCAINTRDSQSGYNALRALIALQTQGQPFFSEVLISGSHLASIAMVARGEADLCAVDCVSYALFKRYAPHALHGTRILTQTATAPGLPYITASVITLKQMREGLQSAFADPALQDIRAALLLDAIEVLPDDAYQEIINMEQVAMKLNYPDLR